MSNNRVFEEALSSFLSAGLAVAGLSLAAFFVYKLSGRSLFEFLTKKPDSFEHDIKKKLMYSGDDDEYNQNAYQRLRAQRQRILAQLRDMRLNSYEQTVFDTCLVTNEEIEVSFADVGALEDIKKQLYNAVIFPLQHPEIFDNPKSLRKPVKGVLLYGMPGTGKTMLARAVAKECGCLFINVQRQIIDHHYYGESERLTAAVFSLAKKLQPVVIFIDEIDALLMNRYSIDGSSSGSEVRKNQVSVMLSLWDGLSSSEKDRIIVIGATNLLSDLDPAALRRMPLYLHVPLPGAYARKDILQVILRHEPLDPRFNIDEVVRETDGFSGSDLKELCKYAVMIPVHEAFEARLNSMKYRHPALRATNSQAELNDELHGEVKIAVRHVNNKDFSEALRLVCPESRKVQQRRNAREAQAAELDPSAILYDLVANMNWAKK